MRTNIQFPPCDGGRKSREFQNNAFLSNESIVYNQATKIKVYPSEYKINLIKISANRSDLSLSFRSLVKKKYAMLNWRRVFVRIGGAKSFVVLVSPKGEKYTQNFVRAYGELLEALIITVFAIFPSLFQTSSAALF